MLTPFARRVISRIRSLKRTSAFGAIDRWTVCEAEPKKLSLLRSRHCTLRLIDLELELLRDKPRYAVHHPLTRTLATHIDIAIVCVTNIAMSPTLQLPVQQVEHKIAEQGRERTSLRSPLHAGADQPVFHHPGVQERPDEFQQPFVFDTLGDLCHQFVVINSIEKFLQIEINHPAVAFGNIPLCLRYSLMRRSSPSKAVPA